MSKEIINLIEDIHVENNISTIDDDALASITGGCNSCGGCCGGGGGIIIRPGD